MPVSRLTRDLEIAAHCNPEMADSDDHLRIVRKVIDTDGVPLLHFPDIKMGKNA
jgi:hypothetical protein